MDNLASSKSYDAQFLQRDQKRSEYRMTGLREAVQEMQRTGSKTPVLLKTVTGIIMMHMTAKARIKKHDQVAINALFVEEFFQLHDLGVFLAQDPKKLTRAQKKAALSDQ